MTKNPTKRAYDHLVEAYTHFNRELFDGSLPPCLITFQRHKGSLGYFAQKRFIEIGNAEVTDEIALNPVHFMDRPLPDVFSTLVHEMVHLWQHHFGDPPQTGYHDKEWAYKMVEIGLIPSHTGKPGGRMVGQNMSDYINPEGKFLPVCEAFLDKNSVTLFQDRWSLAEEEAREKKNASKTKYTCPSCSLNAWAKPAVSIICGTCQEELKAKDQE